MFWFSGDRVEQKVKVELRHFATPVLPLPARSGVTREHPLLAGWLGRANLRCHISFSRIPLFEKGRKKRSRLAILPAKIIALRSSLDKSVSLRFYLCIFYDRRLAMLTLCHFRSSRRRSRFHSVIDVAGKHNTIPFTRLPFWRRPMEGWL